MFFQLDTDVSVSQAVILFLVAFRDILPTARHFERCVWNGFTEGLKKLADLRWKLWDRLILNPDFSVFGLEQVSP